MIPPDTEKLMVMLLGRGPSSGGGRGGGSGGGEDGEGRLDLPESKWAGLSGNQRRNWMRWGGRRGLFAVPRGESEPPPPPGGK